MANSIDLFRGGIPVFRPAFCCGDYPAYMPVGNMQHFEGTPPVDEHAEGARGQGYLNLNFPLVPNILDTDAHRWMRTPLMSLSKSEDVLRLIWIPRYGYVDSLWMQLTKYDTMLDGVYVTPMAERYWWNPKTGALEFKPEPLFDEAMSKYANALRLPLGTPSGEVEDLDAGVTIPADSQYIFARFGQEDNTLPWSWGHDLYTFDRNGRPSGALDEYCGNVCFGLKITGPDAKIKDIWRGKFELWINMKYLQHDCQGFTG